MNDRQDHRTNHRKAVALAWLSVVAAVVTILIKGAAWRVTGSVGMLSDAMESFVNLATAMVAVSMLRIAARPADKRHAFGHEKAEYFSSGIEGVMILAGALAIGWAAVCHMIEPGPLSRIDIGVVMAVVASLVNLGVGLLLVRQGEKLESVTLVANGKHLLTDVWTTAGVVVAIILVGVTGWSVLDPVVALVLAVHVGATGVRVMRGAVSGLMDVSLKDDELLELERILDQFRDEGIDFHAVRTRRAGARCFISMHVLVPGDWSVRQGHRVLHRVEDAIQGHWPRASVFTHLEAIDDPTSWDDVDLE